MQGENSKHKPSGSLYVVATPIGNLEDLTLRALRILGEVSTIACEDTRQTKKLLNKYNIKKPLISYYQPWEKQKIPQIIRLLKNGKDVALVTDSGTPAISDPGFLLIREAIEQGVKIIPLPGASALTTALSAAGLPTHRFLFLGFPPPKKVATTKLLQSLKNESVTLVFYLPTRRISTFLKLSLDILGNRKIVIAREMTKIYEEFFRGTTKELLKSLEGKKLKGEATVLIEATLTRTKSMQNTKMEYLKSPCPKKPS
ncbi:MAG: 16S rRNA (cytidine(1402)-2'-O)-methyltransferase [Candidatus Aminicenantes bacterium]|nr:16S rRNA (cytidine(1402)-2'-O)-methyltransferase [Candidatus Aminicenantes bacterium]MBL7083373.1 16S rRNA (cytidine(1402)-2'-O)-methyltransferase [Candidatus Aminicenantes bacterium]